LLRNNVTSGKEIPHSRERRPEELLRKEANHDLQAFENSKEGGPY
jgi:hypothetical protein